MWASTFSKRVIEHVTKNMYISKMAGHLIRNTRLRVLLLMSFELLVHMCQKIIFRYLIAFFSCSPCLFPAKLIVHFLTILAVFSFFLCWLPGTVPVLVPGRTMLTSTQQKNWFTVQCWILWEQCIMWTWNIHQIGYTCPCPDIVDRIRC